MNTTIPRESQIPGLRRLWKAAFGDPDDFLDDFFAAAFSPDRCRCITEEGEPVAALYWFDCLLEGAKLAYLYAVATDPAHRGRGLCRMLMADTARILRDAGYQGIVLVPQEPELIRMYAGMGYVPCSGVREFQVEAAADPIPLGRITPAEYAVRRRSLLPPGGVIQEGENLTFLAAQAGFYAGSGWIAAAVETGGMLRCCEFLGDPALAPGLVKALDCRTGTFRMPGTERPFAMFRPLTIDCPRPLYFGLAFD